MFFSSRRLWALAFAAALAVFAGLMQRTLQLTPGSPSAVATVSIVVQTTSTEPNSVLNGELITYTLSITNEGSSDLTSLALFQSLPASALVDVSCSTPCGFASIVSSVPEPLGGNLVISTITGISWTLAPLQPGSNTQVVYLARVAGQSEGAQLQFQADAIFLAAGSQQVSSASRTLTVRTAQQAAGKAGVSNAPNWLSADAGGSFSQDWGDFDRDGDVDLVIGSSLGATIYRNNDGRLVVFWHEPQNKQAYAVRWIDADGDGRLELAVAGDSLDKTPVTEGVNYIYQINGDQVNERSNFTSTYQLVRMAVADMDHDGKMDLIASTNIIRTADGCNVWIFGNTDGTFAQPVACLSQLATAALAVADMNNDGWQDVLLGQFPNRVNLLYMISRTVQLELPVETGLQFLPYDFAIGDYDNDGWFDVAAAFPLQREVRVYHNAAGNGFDGYKPIRTSQFLTPLGLDWGNFSGSGRLELLIADNAPKVFRYNGSQFELLSGFVLPPQVGQLWSARGARLQREGDLDISLTNRDRASSVFAASAARLSDAPLFVDGNGAGSVKFGDWNNDGNVDLLFGAGSPLPGNSAMFLSLGGVFANRQDIQSGTGPHHSIFGDVTADGKQDVLVSTLTGHKLYGNGDLASPIWQSPVLTGSGQLAALGDANGDGQLDLLIGSNGGPLSIFIAASGTLNTASSWTSSLVGDVRGLAWMDVDSDGYQDFAVVYRDAPARVFRNGSDGSYSLYWTAAVTGPSTSLGWADFDSDGDPDLAIGNYGAPTWVFANTGSTLSLTPTWASSTSSKTLSLAWGDWNNDGNLELALANEGEASQVFENNNSRPGAISLQWAWSSIPAQWTDAAWGDFDGDGDADLALSQRSGFSNSVFVNTSVAPAHVSNEFNRVLVQPDALPYVYVSRPGTTLDAYQFSASEIVAGPAAPTLTVKYRVFDPSGSRQSNTNITGTQIGGLRFEFSLDGGTLWKTATPSETGTAPTVATRLGTPGTFVWDARADSAISDDARFRVTVIGGVQRGGQQNASNSSVSPPFSVRATTCEWPYGAYAVNNNPASGGAAHEVGEDITFYGFLEAGSGAVTFYWDFGDGTPVAVGQTTTHRYAKGGRYELKMTVIGQGCPITRIARYNKFIDTIDGKPFKMYMPAVSKPAEGGTP